ncbi:cancer-related nucleoside-triphosphatase isoform X1 [Silurus asotus]|uniref:Cancer-related nucleoside-triphosphatase isoform X1 n=1 Tax=Silurus asotus TaxID=30991 RepID=A0AAD5FCH6_SILAS|nr:cancer-related nucleoside-triphosphatase isoform X1 [Silurus asotus]
MRASCDSGSGTPESPARVRYENSELMMIKHVFLTGSPGVGKTTLVQKVWDSLSSGGVSIHGFCTEEVRESGRRVGFDVVTVHGQRGILARVGSTAPSGRREYTVGQYVVDLPSFESLALPLFRNASDGNRKLFVIDEIGKMELFSQAFIRAVRQTLDSTDCTILGTIPVPKGRPLGLVEEIRARRDVKVFMVTKENRNDILDEIVTTLKECLK